MIFIFPLIMFFSLQFLDPSYGGVGGGLKSKKDLFNTIDAAEAKAVKMGGTGHHKIGGYYMPFNLHQDYVEAKGKSID